MPRERELDATASIRFDPRTSRFKAQARQASAENLCSRLSAPLSVILQITRRCHLDCSFCSEPEPIPDPSLQELTRMRDNLAGVPRVFLSGGEPLIRTDFLQILELFYEQFLVGVPTNALASRRLARAMKDRVRFVNVGLDGPRRITSALRGDYDKIMQGILRFRDAGIPLSLTCVVLRSNLPYVPFTAQIADVIGATKLKLVYPVEKGNAMSLPREEFLPPESALQLRDELTQLKAECGWGVTITLTPWTTETEGYSLLVYPDGRAFAWPVFDAPDKVLPVGSLLTDTAEELWSKYPFKLNHVRTYLGASVHVI